MRNHPAPRQDHGVNATYWLETRPQELIRLSYSSSHFRNFAPEMVKDVESICNDQQINADRSIIVRFYFSQVDVRFWRRTNPSCCALSVEHHCTNSLLPQWLLPFCKCLDRQATVTILQCRPSRPRIGPHTMMKMSRVSIVAFFFS
jgi:hypothetical protein